MSHLIGVLILKKTKKISQVVRRRTDSSPPDCVESRRCASRQSGTLIPALCSANQSQMRKSTTKLFFVISSKKNKNKKKIF